MRRGQLLRTCRGGVGQGPWQPWVTAAELHRGPRLMGWAVWLRDWRGALLDPSFTCQVAPYTLGPCHFGGLRLAARFPAILEVAWGLSVIRKQN